MDGDGTPKDLRARLRKKNRCLRCKKKGHWKAECPEKQHNKDGTAPAVFSGLTFLHTVDWESVECGYLEWPVRRTRRMGNGISQNPSGTLDGGQCSRTSVDWRSRMCRMGAKVERCRSPWCTGSLQDDDPKRCRRCSTSHKIDDDAYYDRRSTWGAAVHCGRRRHPGTVAIEFSRETGSDDQFANEQASSSTSQSSRSQARTPHQFVTGTTVENPIRDGKNQLVAKSETEKMSRTAESIHKQYGNISKQTAHLTSPQGSVKINHQDKFVGQDNDHLHLTDSHFSEDDQECDNPSSFSHDTGPFFTLRRDHHRRSHHLGTRCQTSQPGRTMDGLD